MKTRKKSLATAKLPPLVCGIYRNGRLERLSEYPDPRERYCETFNEMSGRFGFSARPLVGAELSKARRSLAMRAARKNRAA